MLVLMVTELLVEGMETKTRQCSNTEMERLWSNLLSPDTICRPRLVTVDLGQTVAGHRLLAPTHLSLRRCSGSCSHSNSLHSCLPNMTTSREVDVVVSPMSGVAGIQKSVCGKVTVEEHESCSCKCEMTPGSCSSHQTFLPLECRCVCSNLEERVSCLDQAKYWDNHLCLCLCPGRPYPTCPNGYIYDYLETCSCMSTQQAAFSQLQLVSVVLVVSLVCSITSIAQCYRRKIGLFRHLRSGQNNKQTNRHSTLNQSFDQAVARKSGMESLQAVEEENIELLNIKKANL